ncbi:MAG: homoserine dehydrogenase, partial [Micrococcales bacterium]|nr:homoserine dehydrogenase [Micrococcales bacterium]
RVCLADVSCEGIGGVTADDVAWAARTGHVVKLLAVAERLDAGISVRVHPALVPLTHPLASVRGAFNAVFIEAEHAGPIMLYGQGAGGEPTASAVVSDVVSAARNRVTGGQGPRESAYANVPVLPPEAAVSRFQVRMDVADRTGVLAKISAALADADVSIESVRQNPSPGPRGLAHLVITTHGATEAARVATIAALERLDVVDTVVSVLRVEGDML